MRIRRLSFLSTVFYFALSSFAFANVVGSDAQNFNPTTSGLDFVTVQSSETLEPGVYNLGVFANYAKNPFPYYQVTATTNSESKKRDTSLIGGDFNLGMGFTKNWDAGVSFPFILAQQVGNDPAVGHYSATGNTEIRLNSKYRFFGNSRHGVGAIASMNFNRIAHNPYVGEGGGPIFNLELAADTTLGQTALGLNLGYRWRNAGTPIADSGIQPIPNQWLASGALSYLVEGIDSKIIAEVLAAFPEKHQLKGATDREYSVMEGLLGLKYDNSSNLAIHIGAGAGMMKGYSSPDFRIYTGINFSFGSVRGKHSAMNDPYATRRPRSRHRIKPVVKNLEEPRVIPEPTPAAPATPATPPAPAAPAVPVGDEVPPANSSQTIREVKIFERKGFNHIVLNSIEFVPNTKNLKPESEAYFKNELLPALRELNQRRPISTIVVEGHTDSVGNPAYNMALSEVRAATVGNLLRQNLGFKIKIQTIGMGSSSPVADNGNYQGRALNRRVEIKVLYHRTSR